MQNIAIVILNTKINQKAFDFYYNPNVFLICADGGATLSFLYLYYYHSKILFQFTVTGFMNIKKKLFLNASLVTLTVLNQKFKTIINHKTALSLKLMTKIHQILKKHYHIYNNQKDLIASSSQVDQQKDLIKQSIPYTLQLSLQSNTLYSNYNFTGELISDYSIVRYFNKGFHTFQFSEIEQEKGISLFPQGTQARINTKGLKWNVTQNNPLILGIFLSTSNEAVEKELEFDSLDNFFFVTQLKDEYI